MGLIGSIKSDQTEKLTSAEMGKLWAIYTGNSMSTCILSYFLKHVEDKDIKRLLDDALKISKQFMNTTKSILEKENFPIPVGFTEEDVNLEAPRLFEDEFYVHYLKYVAKTGMSIYNVAIPLMYRNDVKEFFNQCMISTLELMEQIKNILMNKALIIKPPYIPIPKKINFATEDFLKGFFGHQRPLHALEITHLYDNIENNMTSKALIFAFSQVAKEDRIRELFKRGNNITIKSTEDYLDQLNKVNLISPSGLDHLITTSTISPFSDKIMLFHKMDMFTMKIRSLGNSIAVSGRHDIVFMYTRALMNISLFAEDAVKIMIENGWMEQPPEAFEG